MKKITYILIALILSFIFTIRCLSTYDGLPYIYHWDEVVTSTSSLNTLKTGKIKLRYTENTYGGFMRYSDLLIDVVHFGYLKITGKIESTSDIKTYLDTNEYRTLSPSSFYVWNRIFSVFLSIGLIYFCYLITRFVLPDNYVAWVATVLALSISQYHHDEARVTLPNVPMAFWAMFTVYFSMVFHQSKKIKHLFWAMIGAGLAIATKLSGVLILSIPFIPFLYNLNLYKNYTIKQNLLILAGLGFTPIIIFLAFTPSIFVDYDNWYFWQKLAVTDYNDPKSTQFKKIPGLEHFNYQMQLFWDELGKFLFITSILGAFTLLVPKKNTTNFLTQLLHFILLVGFPVFYLTYFTNQLVAYHRNHMIIYAFTAIWFGLFIGQTVEWSKFFVKSYQQQYQVILALLLVAGFAFGYKDRYAGLVKSSWQQYTIPDTRTQAILKLNEMKTDEIIGIAQELLISEEDLDKLKFPYRIFAHENIQQASQENTLLLVGEYKSSEANRHSYDDSLNTLTKQYKEIFNYAGYNMTCDVSLSARAAPHQNPTIRFLQGNNYEQAKVHKIPAHEVKSNILLFENSASTLKSKKLQKGKYKIKLKMKGTSCRTIFPHVKIYVQDKLITDFFVSAETKSYDFDFDSPELQKIVVKVIFDNDDWIEGKEDRNLFIEGFGVYNSL